MSINIHTSYDNDTVSKLLSLYEKKGKEFYYTILFKKDAKTISNKFLKDDLLMLGEVFEIKVSKNKLETILKDKYVAKKKEEQLYINCVNILKQLHSKIDSLNFNPFDINFIVKSITHKLLANENGDKNISILDRSRIQILDDIIKEYTTYKDNQSLEYIRLISLVVTYYYNEKLNSNYNYHISVFLLYLLSYKKFRCLKYTSFFDSYNKYKEDIERAFNDSEYHYKKGIKDTDFIYQSMIDIILDAYNKIEEYSHQYEIESEQSKTSNLIQIILSKNNYFSVQDLKKEFPNISKSTIDRTLNKLKEEKRIICQLKGRASFWQVTNKGKEEVSIMTRLIDD